MFVLLLVVAGSLAYELRTSALQARWIPQYASQLSYELAIGPSGSIVFPPSGPFDDRRGYSRLGFFQSRLEERGFLVEQQVRVTPQLAQLVGWGVAPPYKEPPATGLTIQGAGGTLLYEAIHNERQFRDFEDIPPLIVTTLTFIENRELLQPIDPRTNPAIEWDRLAKAGLLYTGSKLGLPISIQGGSTLAIQLEKYRHSPGGRTNSVGDKLRQVAAASLKAYRDGGDTRSWRREIVLEYLNTAPLAAAPGYGEIYGIGDGLYAWFGLDLSAVQKELAAEGDSPEKVRAYKHLLSLLIALRAPTHYLQKDRDALETKVNDYTRLLAQEAVIDEKFAAAVAAAPIAFLPRAPVAPPLPFTRQKAPNAIRTTLMELLDVPSFYELDRLHLGVESTIDLALQTEVERLFRNLADRDFVAANGLTQDRMLRGVDPAKVVYSLMLFERTAGGNLLRVQADNLDRPFDINDGVKLDLGSTAKLRTLAHYLEVVALLHEELSTLDAGELARRAGTDQDPITKWALETLLQKQGLDLDTFLQRALDRRYSASPYETFFTGGGIHTFENFDDKDNGRILTVREALRFSTNLVFIRLMRDLVRYHRARLDYDAEAVLADTHSPDRARLLGLVADEEARHVLARVYKAYRGLSEDAAIQRLLGRRITSLRHLAMVFFAWHPGSSDAQLANWLRSRGQNVAADEVRRLVRAYGGTHLTLADYGYLLSRHPLEVWCAGEIAREPKASWRDVLARSDTERQVVSRWLLRTRNRQAQDTRLRIRTEKDAFARMTPYWQRLGFPFDHLVATYATAIGNSSDRPAALAQLMGIIVNDGVKRPMLRLTGLHWAAGTPYETVFAPRPDLSEKVMEPSVARALRGVLADVVQGGTARRVAGAFVRDGKPVPVGGKTGSGDNRFETFNRYGGVTSSRVVNRTATFTFYIGDRYFGVLTGFVPGQEASGYKFTSALAVGILRVLAPAINVRLESPPLPPADHRWANAGAPPTVTSRSGPSDSERSASLPSTTRAHDPPRG